MMTFRKVVVERIGISGPGSDRTAAMNWCAENGLAVTKEFRRQKGRGFQIEAARIVRDGTVDKWTATAKKLLEDA